MYYLGIDIGGTNIVCGLVDQEGTILSKASVKTAVPRSEEAICDDMAKLCLAVSEQYGKDMDQIYSIGIGAPGSANKQTGVVEFSTNLYFHNWELVKMMEERTGKRIFIENDANTAALAEYLVGAAKGTKNAVVITIGTGIGSGIIIDGKLYNGCNDTGGEMGHMVIVHGGEQCSCGRRGCFEQYASASALVRLTKEAMKIHSKKEDTILWELCNGDLSKLSGRSAFQGMKQNDAVSKEVLDRYFDYLGCGLVNVINTFQPEILCIGGGISKEGETLLAPLRTYIQRERYSKHSKIQTRLVSACLGNDAGVIGAALLPITRESGNF